MIIFAFLFFILICAVIIFIEETEIGQKISDKLFEILMEMDEDE